MMNRKMTLMQQQSQLNQQDSAASAQNAKQMADYTHAQALELQKLKNEGLLSDTQLREGARTQKEIDVQREKNNGKENEILLKESGVNVAG